jgi:hypothetical protein
MMRFTWLKVTILSSFLISGCLGGDDENVSCFKIGDAEGTIFVSVGCGNPNTQPLYLWDGGTVAAIEVRRTSDDEVVWRVFGFLENGIEQPVQHGVLPPGTGEEGTETELEYEVEYIVKVERFGSGLTAGGSGTREFTILPEE